MLRIILIFQSLDAFDFGGINRADEYTYGKISRVFKVIVYEKYFLFFINYGSW